MAGIASGRRHDRPSAETARGRRAVIFIISAVALAAVTAGCGATGGRFAGQVKISGSTTVLPVALQASFDFSDLYPRSNVEVQGGGSSVGITQLSAGIVDIADSSRDLQGDELKAGLVGHKIALDVIALIVNPSVSGISDLTAGQVRDVFSGKVTNWKALGGPDREIVVIVRDQASGTREMFDKEVMTVDGKSVENVASAIECSSNGVVRETVMSTRGSIGYLSYGYAETAAKDGAVRVIEYDGVSPDPKAPAGDRRYALRRYLYMFTRGRPTGTTKGFIDFVLSDKVQNTTVKQAGYIPMSEAK